MRTTRIHTAQALFSAARIELEAQASHHLARVLRLRAGDAVTLFDGRGGEYPATITAIDGKRVRVLTGEHLERDCESPLAIHLGIAISRGERMDWIVQKSTELGVHAITPLLTEFTSMRLDDERAGKKLRHWQQVAISACEQSGRNRLPAIHPLQVLTDWVPSTTAERRFVLHPGADSAANGEAPGSIALLVGPEGGFSERELVLAEAAGYSPLQLGPRVLRTETAPLAAIAILQARWGDMGLS